MQKKNRADFVNFRADGLGASRRSLLEMVVERSAVDDSDRGAFGHTLSSRHVFTGPGQWLMGIRQTATLKRQFIASVGCVLLATATGCTTFSKDTSTQSDKPSQSIFSRLPWSKSKDSVPEPYPNPVKLAATWTPDTLTQVGRIPTRGFGARVYFYDEKSRPVPVEGTLIVHGFDEKAETKGGGPSIKRYEFTPDQFTSHFSNSDLGASYSVWIPWDAVGGDQTRVSLVASFKTAEGKMVQGSPTTVLLPGKKDSSAETLAQRYAPEFRQWQAANAGDKPLTSGLTTTTIRRDARSERSIPELSTPSSGVPNWNVARDKSTNSRSVAMKSTAPKIEAEIKANDAKPEYQTLPASTRLPQR